MASLPREAEYPMEWGLCAVQSKFDFCGFSMTGNMDFQTGHFADVKQFTIDSHFADVGQVLIDLTDILLVTLGRLQLFYNDRISRNQELDSPVNK